MRLIAFFLWIVLLTPAMNIGKAWQSSAEAGRVVSVKFKSEPIEGQMLFKTDGSAWLKDAQGTEYRLDGTEIITGHLLPPERSMFDIPWRGIAPIVLITMVLLGIQFRRKS